MNKTLDNVLKNSTVQTVALCGAMVVGPLAGWAGLTYSHNANYLSPSQACEVTKHDVRSELISAKEKSDSIFDDALFVPAYAYAAATDVGNAAYRMINCQE